MTSNTSTQVNSSDPAVAIQVQRENAALQRSATLAAAPSVNGSSTTTTTTASRVGRSIAPVVSGSEVLYPQSTTTTSSNAVTINSSVNNDVGDVTTVYSTGGAITVNPINQTINQYTSVDSGVSQIVAGNGVTITSTGGSGTGVVTIGSDASYSNSNVASYLPTYTGNVGAGNVNVTGTVYTSGISSTGLASLTILNVSTTANLGAAGNVKISGGTNGYVLQTDGAGNLTWTAQTGGGNGAVAGSNTQVQFNDAGAFGGNTGFTFNKTTGVFASPFLAGNGNGLSNIQGANVSGFVPNANVANTAFAVAGANVSGFVPNANVANTAFAVAGANVSGTVGNANLSQYLNVSDVNNNFSYHVVLSAGSGDKSLHIDADDNLQYNPSDGTLTATRVDATYVLADLQFSNGYPAANVTGLGNIASINLTGSNANVLYGNGVFAPASGGGSSSELINGNNSFVLDSAGNVVFEGNGAGQGINRGVVWDYGANANGVNSELSQDNFGVTVRAYTENGGGANGYSGSVNIVTNQSPATNTWTFDGDGNLTIPNGANIAVYGNTTQINTCRNGFLGLNSYDAGSNNIARVGISSADKLVGIGVSDPITELDYNWTFINGGGTIFPTLDVQRGDNPSGTIQGQTLLFGDNTQEAIISTPDGNSTYINSQRLVINPGAGAPTTGGEGGDIYLWAGRGGNASGSGGDIKIRGGQGGSNTSGGSGGSGGYIRIEAGDASNAGAPGYVDINGGNSATAGGGYVEIYGGQGATVGGDANLKGGYGYTDRGGNVNIWGGGSANGQVNEGNVNIQTGGNTWTFDPSGNLTLPGNTFAVNYANGTQVSIGGGGANTGNVTFSDQIILGTGTNDGGGGLYLAPGNGSIANSAVQYLRVRGGDAPTHIHLDTGNNQYYDQYFGADSRYLKLEANGNVVINADDYLGNSATWTLDTDGNLILAGGNSVIQSIANSSLDPLNPNVSTMVLTPDPGYGSQALVLDPTSVGHIHLRSPGSNIDQPSANLFLGGEASSFEVGQYNGAVPNLFIHSNNNTWTFDIDGNITFPRDGSNISTDPYLKILGGPSPQILSEDASLAGPANLAIVTDYLNLSGSTGNRIILQADAGAIATDAAMVLSTNLADPGNIVSWTLDTTGNLYLPDTTSVIANVSITLEANDSGNITGLSVIGDANANLYAHGNVTIVSDSSNTNATWAFGTNGNLTLPGNLVIAGNTSVFGTNASLLQTTDDRPLIALSSGANGAIATTWVEDVGNIGTSNIAAVYANPIPGSGIIRIAVGQNGGLGPNLWDFNANGTTTFPGDLIGNGASPAPSISGFNSISALEFTNGTSNVTVTANASSWTFGTNGNLTLPEGGIVTNNIPPVTFDILYQYDDLEWDGITVTFTNASSTYMLGVLALMQAGDPITLVGPGGPISTTVAIPYTGGSAGYFTVTEANSPIQITQFTLPNRLTSVNGVTLTTNARNYLFTEAGVTQSPVLTVDTLPSGQYAVAGFRAFVSDANLAPVGNFGEIVGNSGSNTVCVWCDGTNWRIG